MNPRSGDASLAHSGVLFLDELPEFRRDILEALHQPLEEGTVSVLRARARLQFPARFSLLAAMNPCEFVPFLQPPAGPLRQAHLHGEAPEMLDLPVLHMRLQVGVGKHR